MPKSCVHTGVVATSGEQVHCADLQLTLCFRDDE